MKKRLLSLLSALLMVTLLASPVSAGRGIGFSSVQFSLGSLIADGFVTFLGRTDVIVHLDASGQPAVTCTNQGGNSAPGQNPPNISASGAQGVQSTTKNGKAPFDVEAVPPETVPGSQGGCPNDNWTAHIDFVFWDRARLTVTDLSGNVLLQQSYTCHTTRFPPTVDCQPVP